MSFGLPKFNIKQELIKGLGVESSSPSEIRSLIPPKQLKMAIIPSNEPSNPILTTLILNPESVTETKAANWIQHNIPGQSDPLLQWVSGSSRTVTFMAKVTLDISENFTVDSFGDSEIWTLDIEPELSRISEVTNGYNAAILSKLSSVTFRDLPNDPNNVSASNLGQTRWKQSIQPQLDYYRSLLIPREGSRRNQVKTPPLVKLYMGDILGAASYSRNQDFILASYNFNIVQTTPELLPTQADVTFTFIEYNDKGKSYKPVAPTEINKNDFKRVGTVRVSDPAPNFTIVPDNLGSLNNIG